MNKASHRSAHLLGNHFPFLLLHLQQFLSSSSYSCVWPHVSSFSLSHSLHQLHLEEAAPLGDRRWTPQASDRQTTTLRIHSNSFLCSRMCLDLWSSWWYDMQRQSCINQCRWCQRNECSFLGSRGNKMSPESSFLWVMLWHVKWWKSLFKRLTLSFIKGMIHPVRLNTELRGVWWSFFL